MVTNQSVHDKLKEQFLHVSQLYCDYNATTPMPYALVEGACEAYKNHWLNSSASYHQAEQHSKKIAELSRKFSCLVGVNKATTVICSCATEAINQAIYSLAISLGNEAEIIITDSEHSAVKKSASKWFGERVVSISTANLLQDCSELNKIVKNNTKKVFFMQSSNNETGIVNPIKQIREIIGTENILVLDASQSFGKQENFPEVFGYADVVILSPHKFYGPKGFGILIWSEKAGKLSSPIDGGGQQANLRGGTENTPAIYLLEKWLDSVPNLAENFFLVENFRNAFENKILSHIENSISLSQRHPRLMNTATIYIPNILSELLVQALDKVGIMASAGSACSAGASEPSKSYLAAGITWDRAHSVVRFSFGYSNLRGSGAELADQVISIINQHKRPRV